MALNKIVYKNRTLIDLTNTTAVESDVLNGKVFYKANGSAAVGTNGNSLQLQLKNFSTGSYVSPQSSYQVEIGPMSLICKKVSEEEQGGDTPSGDISLQTKTAIPTESIQVITADSGYDGLSSVQINAISSTYIGSGVTQKSAQTYTPTENQQTIASGQYLAGTQTISAIPNNYIGSSINRRNDTDLSVSDNTITVPAGYYETSVSKSVATGSEGVPIAKKGTVSNHSVSITPSVTNTAGYIAGGTKTGTVITVTASELDSGTKSISSNGTGINVVGYASVDVNVPSEGATLQTKSVTYTPTESKQTEAIAADNNYDGLDKVNITINAISSTYIGSDISRRSSSDLTINGATIIVPNGYYSAQVSGTIASGSATTPATTITANPSISVSSSGLITATTSTSQNVTPTVSAGYISSGTAGKITVSGSKTQQLTSKAATTYNTSTTDQTIASGTYLTGTQTIKAVKTSGISAANIKAGTLVKVGDANDDDRIINVTGTFTSDANAKSIDIINGKIAYVNGQKITGSLIVQTIYQGSTAPSASTGINGDIYIQS